MGAVGDIRLHFAGFQADFPDGPLAHGLTKSGAKCGVGTPVIAVGSLYQDYLGVDGEKFGRRRPEILGKSHEHLAGISSARDMGGRGPDNQQSGRLRRGGAMAGKDGYRAAGEGQKEILGFGGSVCGAAAERDGGGPG